MHTASLRAPSLAPPLAAAALAAASIWPLRHWVDGPALALFTAYDGSLWTAPAEVVTELGHWIAWLVGTACVALAARAMRADRLARGANQLALALLLAGVIGTALKVAFGAPAPGLALSLGSHDFTWFRLSGDWHAFPSGHAVTAGAVVATSWLLALRWRAAIAGAGLFVAASRFIIAVHFVSDVVAGLALGALCAFAVHEAAPRIIASRRRASA